MGKLEHLPEEEVARHEKGAPPCATPAIPSRTGVATYVEHGLLDEQAIRALAEAVDLLEIEERDR